MRKLILTALLALSLIVLPKPAFADGCNSTSCSTSGSYWIWDFPFPVTCYWTYTVWFDNYGSYSYYDSCGGSFGLFNLGR